ncbi:MAG: M14 family metallopeptidase [Candidatus Adlerbacteria bacterium]|nr:M14 family metallopeptidase [Candidatus Adlerbacteria bacterium]
MKTTYTIITVVILLGLFGAGIYFFPQYFSFNTKVNEQSTPAPTTNEQATTTVREPIEVIGKSVEGRDISAYHYGTGDTELLFVGGIHGGYSWNTALVGYELMDYLEANPSEIPAKISVTVVPILNPDGLYEVVRKEGRFEARDIPSGADTVSGRFNANNVDLNRNFDCDWEASGTWQSRTVSGGSEAFSEPEVLAFKNYIEANKPTGAVVYYSAAGGVFASECHGGVLSETLELTNEYADASGYKAYEEFDFYTITGDMVNWLAKEGIPAISVLLTNHTDVEWDKNLSGIKALFEHYAE